MKHRGFNCCGLSGGEFSFFVVKEQNDFPSIIADLAHGMDVQMQV